MIEKIAEYFPVNERFFVNDFYFFSRSLVTSWAETSRFFLETEVFSRVNNKVVLTGLQEQYIKLEIAGKRGKEDLDRFANELLESLKETTDYYVLVFFFNVTGDQWNRLIYGLEHQWSILLDKKVEIPLSVFLVTPQSYNLLSRLFITA